MKRLLTDAVSFGIGWLAGSKAYDLYEQHRHRNEKPRGFKVDSGGTANRWEEEDS
jgi:hypothetical protein